MKHLMAIGCTIGIMLFIWFLSCCSPENNKKNHIGPIIDKGKEQPYEVDNGKSTDEYPAVYYVVIEDDSLHKALRFNVDIATYYDYKIGDRVCFKVNDRMLSQCGN